MDASISRSEKIAQHRMIAIMHNQSIKSDLVSERDGHDGCEKRDEFEDFDILLHSYTTPWTGYGQIGHWLGRSLHDRGVRVRYNPIDGDETYYGRDPFVLSSLLGGREGRNGMILTPKDTPTLQLTVPFHDSLPSSRLVRFTMWETTRVSLKSIAYLNRTRAVVVPCKWNAECLKSQGVSVPVYVVPLGVSPSEGYCCDPEWEPSIEVFRFGMAGRLNHGGIRKGINEGMWAFLDAFPKSIRNVELKVKIFEDDVNYLDFRPTTDDRIRVNIKALRPLEMAEWYKQLNCLFVPSKGEGFGLHTLQAMACGLPVIAAPWGGTTEFWDESCGWGLGFDVKPADGFYAGQGGGDWAVPRHESMVGALRYAYAHREESVAKGRNAVGRAGEFTWDRTGEKLVGVLKWTGLL
jgi:glycosyltransferase involved in cell wall biosynthesis